MMQILRRGAGAGILLAMGLWPGSAPGQLLGAMGTGAVEEVGAQIIGGHVGITNDFVSILGQARYGVASSFDLGAKLAYLDFEKARGGSLGINADGRLQILDVFLADPFDLAVGPEVSFFRVNDSTNWYFGAYVAISKEYALENGRQLTPYGRVGLRLHRLETTGPADDDLNTGVSGGLKYSISGYTSLWGEVMFEDAGTGAYFGFQYELR